MIKYVKIKKPDTLEIRELVRAFCEETGADPEQLDILLARLPKMHVFGALNGSLVGIGGYYAIGEKAIFDFLYVQPEHRGKSIAGRLHKKGREDAKLRGLTKAVIFTKPETAIRYLKLGYYTEKFRVLEGGL